MELGVEFGFDLGPKTDSILGSKLGCTLGSSNGFRLDPRRVTITESKLLPEMTHFKINRPQLKMNRSVLLLTLWPGYVKKLVGVLEKETLIFYRSLQSIV